VTVPWSALKVGFFVCCLSAVFVRPARMPSPSQAADLLGTTDPAEVVFGPSMTALSFKVAGGLRSSLGPGSNVVLDPFSQ